MANYPRGSSVGLGRWRTSDDRERGYWISAPVVGQIAHVVSNASDAWLMVQAGPLYDCAVRALLMIEAFEAGSRPDGYGVKELCLDLKLAIRRANDEYPSL